jgi:predicted transposase YbfD/YdcC
VKLRRLRFVANNQRFCVLPGRRRKNLASAVLSRTLRRLSADAEHLYGDPVLLVETFTDPSRHEGTCYRAANFVEIGTTSGYARRNGTWVHHGEEKCAWVYPLRKDARSLLQAPFDHPLIAAQRRRTMIDLNTVVIEGDHGLYARLCELKDHRKKKGIRHQLAAILLVCAAAVLCGAKGAREIAEWARDLDDDQRERLHCRRRPATGELVVPSESTVQRTLRKVDKEAFDTIVNETMHDLVMRRIARTDSDETEGDEASDNTSSDDETEDAPAPRCLAVDGKSLRGAVVDDGRLVHLLSVLTHEERVVIGQQEVDHKTNEIRHFRPLLENLDIAGHLVTADALHTQRDHARFLIEEKSCDFFFYADGNQPKLYEAIAMLDEEKWSEPYTESSKGHGRIETRTIWSCAEVPKSVSFPHVAQVIRILREVDDAKTNTARHTETVYALTSSASASRPVLLHASRGHWGIESLHWVRDATMREDASKVRSGSAPRVLATLRNLAIGVLRIAGATNIAQALRHLSRRPGFALTLLGV